MKRIVRGLSLAAALFSASLPAWGQQRAAAVGDLPGYWGSGRTFVGDTAGDPVSDPVGDSWEDFETIEGHPPVSHSDLQPKRFGAARGSQRLLRHAGPCDQACDDGCDARGAGIFRKVLGRPGLLDHAHETWFTAEVLLWFPQQRRVPALITTAGVGQQPILPNANVAFGGDIGGDLRAGFRVDGGRFLNKHVGIGGRFWMIDGDSQRASLSGNGTGRSIGRPFFNTELPGYDSILVNLDGNFAGNVHVESDLRMLAAEAYGRLKFGRGANYRVDLIGGYTHFNIDDRLWARSETIGPSISRFFDDFDAENQFHGGQLGIESTIEQGKWALTSLVKVHLGNMNQVIDIRGSSQSETIPVPPTPPTVTNFNSGGALAFDDSLGRHERNKFAFAPELNLKLAYRFRPNVLLSVGYSFIYFDNVLLAGDHIDPVFDGSTLLTNGPHAQRPFEFRDSGLWVQGIDLGFVLDF